MIQTQLFILSGMDCVACVLTLDGALEETTGIKKAETNYATQQTKVTFDATKITEEKIVQVIQKTGYTVTNYHPSNE